MTQVLVNDVEGVACYEVIYTRRGSVSKIIFGNVKKVLMCICVS